MSDRSTTALVICPPCEPGEGVSRKVAGLTVGERLLLALSFQGIKRVGFLGTGTRPQSDRAGVEIFEPSENEGPDEHFLILTSDLVFDRGMLSEGDEPDPDLPIRYVDAPAWKAVVADPWGWLALLDRGRAGMGRRFAIRVTDRASARLAERSLLESLRKPIDGFVSRHLNRHISLAVTRHLVKTGLRPNHVTAFIMLFGIAAGVFGMIAEPWWTLVLAGLFFQSQSVLDGCDGEIARLTYRFSHRGQWLDTIGDDLTNWLFTLGLAVGQARVMDLPWLYAAGGFVFLAQVWAAAVMYQRLIKMGTGDLLALPNAVTGESSTGRTAKVLRVFQIIAKKDTFSLVTAIMAAAQIPLVAFVLIGLGSVGMAAGLTVNEYRLRKQGI